MDNQTQLRKKENINQQKSMAQVQLEDSSDEEDDRTAVSYSDVSSKDRGERKHVHQPSFLLTS